MFNLNEDKQGLRKLCDEYQSQGYCYLGDFFNPQMVGLCKDHVRQHGTRSVFLNQNTSERKWSECFVEENSPLFHVLSSSALTRFLFKVTGFDEGTFSYMKTWINVHRLGESIGVHTDYGGMQCVVCLEQPSFQNQGALYLKFPNEERAFFLNPGDGFVFKATEIPHYTTPLIATEAFSNPQRMMLVLRYYQKKGR